MNAGLCRVVDVEPSELGTELLPEKFRLFKVDKSRRPIQSKGSQLKALITDPHEAIKCLPCVSKSIFWILDSRGKLCETHSEVSMSKKRITLSSLPVASKYSNGLKRRDRTYKSILLIIGLKNKCNEKTHR